MTWQDWAQAIGLVTAAVTAATAGGIATVRRWRAGKPPPEVPPGYQETDPLADTGQFAAVMAQAPAAALEEMARSLREIAAQRPATRADVRMEVQALRGELEPKFTAHSNAIHDLRAQIESLPCRDTAPVPCPEVRR